MEGWFRAQGPAVAALASALWASAMLLHAQAPAPASAPVANQGLNTPQAQPAMDPARTAKQQPDQQLDTPGVAGSGDHVALSSPVPPAQRPRALPVGTEIDVQLSEQADSGSRHNGEMVHGTLLTPLRTSRGGSLPRGTPIEGTIVSSAKAGTISSGGVLSLQLTRIGNVNVVSDVLDFDGQEGHKDVADSAPKKGTEAIVQPGAVLRFHLLENGEATGLLPGVAPADVGGSGKNRNAAGSGSAGGRNTSTGSPSTQPGVSQRPVRGATQGVVPRPPR